LQIACSMSFYDESGNTRDGLEELRLAELERRARSDNGGRALPLRDWVALAEAWRIAQALRETRGNRSAAARALGIGRRTLYSKMEKLGLEPSWGVTGRRVDFVRRPLGVREGRRG
jgi:DNA-binding NtrC family response regulator